MIQLLSGDCLEVMKDLSDNSIDCFICDLPYGQLSNGVKDKVKDLRYDTGKTKPLNSYGGCEWDVKINLDAFWIQVKRLAKNDNTPILMFCNTRFGIDLINSNPSWFRYDLVWNKERGVSFLLANKQPMKSHEMIYIFSKKGSYYKRIDGIRCPLSVINMPNASKKGGHPTEKPVELYKWLIERYCPSGGVILDPTAGSFNCIRAAIELNLNAIGIEKDKTFYDNAVKALLAPVSI